MPRVIASGRVPIHLWASDPPAGAIRQLEAIATQPYLVGHIAAMPDLHVAEGVAVGTVFATADVLVPAALGSDLGCGMAACRFAHPAAALSREDLQEILRELVRRTSPKAPKGEPVTEPLRLLLVAPLSTRSLEHDRERFGLAQLGTVGGGNHFLELDRDAQGDLWLLVHSGSRAVGGAIGAHHGRAAQAISKGPLPGLPETSDPGRAFVHDLAWALTYARANRDRLLEIASRIVAEHTGTTPDPSSHVDLPHNLVAKEIHDGVPLWIHRKGAAPAPAGARVLIPGSMGTASYIVEGLGTAESYGSCSHGAGRVMSRREAREQIRPGDLARALRRVVYDEEQARALVEEAPGAYRDIGAVLQEQADLVRPLLRLEPIAVFKS
jgi:tRNA-splicing ligase RtcB